MQPNTKNVPVYVITKTGGTYTPEQAARHIECLEQMLSGKEAQRAANEQAMIRSHARENGLSIMLDKLKRSLVSKTQQLRTQRARVTEAKHIINCLVSEWASDADNSPKGDPSHWHTVPGQWDNESKGACQSCELHDRARKFVGR